MYIGKGSNTPLFGLTFVVMMAFALNSLLCREALTTRAMGAADFTAVRLASGALTLWLLVAITHGKKRIGGSWISAAALFGYAACFSFAYLELSAGTGALLLFGAVQVSMISWALVRGERLTVLKWAGAIAAFAGLVWFMLPSVQSPSLVGAALMVIAGICWGVYSLRGRGATNPTVDTAGNFARAVPFASVLYVLPVGSAAPPTWFGWILAIASGALASGLGYALWYSVLPRLAAGTSATVQLSVPIIAAVGGVLFLGEPITGRLMVASTLVLGGISLFIHSKGRG